VRLLLDVDGVLNAVCPVRPFVWDNYQQDVVMGFTITYSPTVAEFLRGLPEHVEVQWLTTWTDRANRYISPLLDLPQYIVAGQILQPQATWWKLAVARDFWEADQTPFIWLDDDIAFDSEAVEWLSTLSNEDYLAISPWTEEGLTAEHLDLVTAFIERVSATSLHSD
jgi:hypothetical protein